MGLLLKITYIEVLFKYLVDRYGKRVDNQIRHESEGHEDKHNQEVDVIKNNPNA